MNITQNINTHFAHRKHANNTQTHTYYIIITTENLNCDYLKLKYFDLIVVVVVIIYFFHRKIFFIIAQFYKLIKRGPDRQQKKKMFT